MAPGTLEDLGKTAARLAETSGISLTEAAVHTLSQQKLAADQVRRVVEACNIEAVNRKFASLRGVDRIVDIAGGPADPSQVMQALKVAQAPRAMEIEALEYSAAPQYEKRSGLLPASVAPNLYELHSKLAAAHDEVTSRVEASSFRMEEALDALKTAACAAARQGATLSELYTAWCAAGPEPMAKVAAAQLRGDIAWGAPERTISPAHTVVTNFVEFAKVAQSYHVEERARRNLETELGRISNYLQGAEG